MPTALSSTPVAKLHDVEMMLRVLAGTIANRGAMDVGGDIIDVLQNLLADSAAINKRAAAEFA